MKFQGEDPSIYPTLWVGVVVLATVLEFGVFAWLAQPWRGEWVAWRLTLAFVVLSLWLVACLQVVMHMPGYVLNHHIWLLALTAYCGALLAGYLTRLGWRRISSRNAE